MSSLLEYDTNIFFSELGQQDAQCMCNVKLSYIGVIRFAAEKQ